MLYLCFNYNTSILYLCFNREERVKSGQRCVKGTERIGESWIRTQRDGGGY